jgi:uncharacterized protein YkwD
MRSLLLTVSVVTLTLAACVSISTPTPSDTTPRFVTATLPPTKTPFVTPATLTLTSPTSATLSVTAAANCKDGAVLIQDVTIPDGTNVAYGLKFTKTWQFRNTGSCPWSGYTIAFVSGDRMNALDSVPIPDTAPKADTNVSVDLVAPSSDGIYTGFFELRNSAGQPLAIGIEKTFWVKITVGNVTLPTLPASTSAVPTITGTITAPKGPLSCKYVTSPSYPSEIVNLINNARTSAGLPALTVDSRLASAAQSHSIDMACYGLLSHSGSDGSTPQQRIAAAGYGATFSEEMIYAGSGAYPQNAFDWWMNDPTHHDVIFDARVSDIGVGFAFVSDSAYGDYYTVDVGSQ